MSTSKTWFNFCPTTTHTMHTTNPNNHSSTTCNQGYQNYSKYECTNDMNSNKYWVLGTRNPQCKIGCRPYRDFFKTCLNEVDNLKPSHSTYQRNGRFSSGILNA